MVEGRHFPKYMTLLLLSALLTSAIAMPLAALALPAPKSANAMSPSLTDVEEVGILAPSLPAKPAPAPEAVTPKPAITQSGETPLFPDEPPPAPSNDFLSWGYMGRVLGTLVLLLGAFYLISKLLFRRPAHPHLSADWAHDLSPTEGMPPQGQSHGILHQLFSRLHLSPSIQLAQRTQWLLTPRTLTRTRLGPGREILVMQVAQRLLVVAATPSSMSLLTELPIEILHEGTETSASDANTDPEASTSSIRVSSNSRRQPSRLNELIDKTVDKYLSPDRKLTIVPPLADGEHDPFSADEDLWDGGDAINYAHAWTDAPPEQYVASTEMLDDYDDRY